MKSFARHGVGVGISHNHNGIRKLVPDPGWPLWSISPPITSGLYTAAQRRHRSTKILFDDKKLDSSTRQACLRNSAKKYKISEHHFDGHWHRVHFDQKQSQTPCFFDIPLENVTPYPDNDLSSTRPATIVAPIFPDSEGDNGEVTVTVRLRYYYRLGRAYLTFYKTGLKNVWANWKETRSIRQRFALYERRLRNDPNQKKYLRTAKQGAILYMGGKAKDGGRQLVALTRKEYQLLVRTSRDVKTLPSFALILTIFGEFTPLVILLLPSSLLPATCRIEKQLRQDYERVFRRRERLDQLVRDLFRVKPPEEGTPEQARWELRLLYLEAYRCGITPVSTWIPVLSQLYYKYWLRRKFVQYWNQVFNDMILVRREGGYARLEPAEVFLCTMKYMTKGGMKIIGQELKDKHGAIDVDSQQLKEKLVPLLEHHADQVLSYDFARLDPRMFWTIAHGT